MSTFKPTIKADMTAAFPDAVPGITGEPSLQELIRVLKHLIVCSQSHETQGNNNLNLLHVCLPNHLYERYLTDPVNQAYPQPIPHPGNSPTFTPEVQGGNSVRWNQEKITWEYNKIIFDDERTMNAALIDRFLYLLTPTYRAEFADARIANPNMTFQNAFHFFNEKYGTSTEVDREENKSKMKQQWQPQDGFEKLIRQIEDGVLYAYFSDYPINDKDIVDMAITHILKTGIFANQYAQWHTRPDDQKMWANFKTFWNEKVRLKRNTTITAGQLGFGGNAVQSSATDVDAEYENSVNNFAEAHAATQNIIQGLTTNNNNLQSIIPTIQQQLAFVCQQVNAVAQANQPMYQQQYQPQQQYQQRNGGRGGGRNNGRGGRGGGRGGGGRNNNNNGVNNVKKFENWNYCWTHGFDCPDDHHSGTCFNQAPGHQVNANRTNTMGGSMKNSHRTVLPSTVGRQPSVPYRLRNQQNQQGQQGQQGQQFNGAAQQMPAPAQMPNLQMVQPIQPNAQLVQPMQPFQMTQPMQSIPMQPMQSAPTMPAMPQQQAYSMQQMPMMTMMNGMQGRFM